MGLRCREMKLDVNILWYSYANRYHEGILKRSKPVCNEEKLHSKYQKYQTSAVHGEKSNQVHIAR